MHAVVVYDSMFGNTRTVAEAVARSLGSEARLVSADRASSEIDPRRVELIVVGSPTQGGRPTAAIRSFFADIPERSLRDIPAAAFDTRIAAETRGLPLRLLMRVIGYAAPRISDSLQSLGARPVVPPEGFFVIDREGPLAAGELDRAERWAQSLVQLAV